MRLVEMRFYLIGLFSLALTGSDVNNTVAS